MRNAAQRLARLAEALNFSSDGDCVCSRQPKFATTKCDVDGRYLPSDTEEVAKLDFTCPVHGKVGPELHVKAIQFCCGEG